jgi:site-specific DNA-methyltransferase (adenine-specific)
MVHGPPHGRSTVTSPYYEDESFTIYLGDCREVLPGMPFPDVDAVIADPPYGETSLQWDRWPTDWPDVIAQHTTADQLWAFGSMRMFLERGDQFGRWSFGQDVIWRKHNGSGFHADRFKRVHEHVLQWYRGEWGDLHIAPVFTQDATRRAIRKRQQPAHTGDIGVVDYATEDGGPRLQRSVIEVRSCNGYAQHPTQKPTGIIDPLLAYSVPDGGLVLDPFLGAGSTLRAAKDQCRGLRGIGIEGDERYCEIAAKRMAQEVLDFGGVLTLRDPMA